MSVPMFLKPVFKETIWGGSSLRKDYGYDIPSDHTGEAWAVSAHQNGDCEIISGEFRGSRLSQIYKEHREMFGGYKTDVFPLLIKIIDAQDDLSIQVHPDDEYAKINENGALGKTECWYIIDCKKDANIVIGHNAKTKQELTEMIENGRWNELIRVIPIKPGDFFQIEPGTVHAIKGGTQILETQQNSDITYRLYDYGRLQNGKPRELHIKKSIDVIRCPHKDVTASGAVEKIGNSRIHKLINCSYYSVSRLDVNGSLDYMLPVPFSIYSVLKGDGSINDVPVKKGDHFILTSDIKRAVFNGNMMLITSNPN